MKVIKGIVHQPYEVRGSSVFYAFSYYFDRAVEAGLIGAWAQASEPPFISIIFHADYHVFAQSKYSDCIFVFFSADGSRGGMVEVRDFKKKAKEGTSHTPSSLGLDKLASETVNLASYIYSNHRNSVP